MKLFFEVCKEFFDLLYLPFVSDIIENEIIGEELYEDFDEEKGYQHEEDNRDVQQNEYIQPNLIIQVIHDNRYDGENKEEHDDEVVCECDFLRQILSVINARIYKFINDNKSE
jgi:hypothetical protein